MIMGIITEELLPPIKGLVASSLFYIQSYSYLILYATIRINKSHLNCQQNLLPNPPSFIQIKALNPCIKMGGGDTIKHICLSELEVLFQFSH